MHYLRDCFKDTNREQLMAWLLLIPVVGLFGALAFSGLTIMAPIGWVGLYVIARTLYMGIRYPETLEDADDADADESRTERSKPSGGDELDDETEDREAAPVPPKGKGARPRSAAARRDEPQHSTDGDDDFQFNSHRDAFD